MEKLLILQQKKDNIFLLRARRIVLNENIIVSSIEGSLSSIALIEKEYDNTLCSTGFYVINSKSLNSEILLVLLRSIIGQLHT